MAARADCADFVAAGSGPQGAHAAEAADADAACFCCLEAADAVALAPCSCGCRTLHVCAGCLWGMFARAEFPEAAVECTVCRRSHTDAAILWALRHGRELVRHLPLGAPAHYERVAQIIALLPALACWGIAYDEARRLAREFAALGPAHAGAARVGFELGRVLARLGDHYEAEAVLRPVARQQAGAVARQQAGAVARQEAGALAALGALAPSFSERALLRTRLELVALQARFYKRGDYVRPRAMRLCIEREARALAGAFETLAGRADRDCVLAQGVLARFLSTRALRELPRVDDLPRARTRGERALLRRARDALGDACDAHLECGDPCLELNWAKLYSRFELLSGLLLQRAGGQARARTGPVGPLGIPLDPLGPLERATEA